MSRDQKPLPRDYVLWLAGRPDTADHRRYYSEYLRLSVVNQHRERGHRVESQAEAKVAQEKMAVRPDLRIPTEAEEYARRRQVAHRQAHDVRKQQAILDGRIDARDLQTGTPDSVQAFREKMRRRNQVSFAQFAVGEAFRAGTIGVMVAAVWLIWYWPLVIWRYPIMYGIVGASCYLLFTLSVVIWRSLRPPKG